MSQCECCDSMCCKKRIILIDNETIFLQEINEETYTQFLVFLFGAVAKKHVVAGVL